MPSFSPMYVVVVGLIIIIAVAAFMYWRKRSPASAANAVGWVRQEVSRFEPAKPQEPRVATTWTMPAPPTTPAPAEPAAATPNSPAAGGPNPPPDIFVDRDDLMKWLGSTGFAFAVTIDGSTVHPGFGPAVNYYTQPAGGMSRMQPGAQP